MISRKLILALMFGLGAHVAHASSDNLCEPGWTLNQSGYDRCSGLPFLTPGNDTRINFKLLLVDDGKASLRARPVGKDEAELGYGAVPFSLETFESAIFASRDKDHAPGDSQAYPTYGSRCVSNEGGKADFIAAVEQSADISAAERKLLIEERKKLNPNCADKPTTGAPPASTAPVVSEKTVSSAVAKQFMGYLVAVSAFYDGRYPEAEARFRALGRGRQPWLREAAVYMLGRTELNRAQRNAFDEYGISDLAKVDTKTLLEAETHFNGYLKTYPEGRYAASARGLLRRIYWLSNRYQKLADEYAWQLAHPDSPLSNLALSELVQEVDHKLLPAAAPGQVTNPLLLAVLDLALMRPSNASAGKQLAYGDLERQRPLFGARAALHDYLLAAHSFYVRKDPEGALKKLPGDIPATMTYLDFSRLVLRGLALEAVNDRAGARDLWLRLLRSARRPLQAETVQLALAINYEYGHHLEKVFAPDSPIKEPAIRSILIRNSASPGLLRSIIKARNNSAPERHTALYTLLFKDLLQGRYEDFVKDYELLPRDASKYGRSSGMGVNYGEEPRLALFTWTGASSDDGYDCPSTREIAGLLATNPNDPYGLLCLGDFINANGLDYGIGASGSSAISTSGAGKAVLGASPSAFPGQPFQRAESYKSIIAAPDVAPSMKAYALYRSIKCYATSGYNHCGGKDVEKTVRKSWFTKLKKQYGNTIWAKSLKYYW